MKFSDSRVNLIQGSVIYMKKMRNSKRGFTLTEILIVTAIVVIVSAAAFTGVAITLSRARNTQKNLKENNGDNFEVAARSEVDAINENAADFAEIPTYKPKDSESSEESSDESSDNSESTNGGGNGAEPNTPTPKPTATPTPKPTATPKPIATPKPAGGIQSGVLASTTSTSQVSFNNYREDTLNFDSSVKNANTVTVTYAFSGSAVTSCQNWGHLGSGAPTVTIKDNKVTLVFDVANMESWQKDNMMNNKPQFHSGGSTTIQIESVSTT